VFPSISSKVISVEPGDAGSPFKISNAVKDALMRRNTTKAIKNRFVLFILLKKMNNKR